jgi:hypothetical protein
MFTTIKTDTGLENNTMPLAETFLADFSARPIETIEFRLSWYVRFKSYKTMLPTYIGSWFARHGHEVIDPAMHVIDMIHAVKKYISHTKTCTLTLGKDDVR